MTEQWTDPIVFKVLDSLVVEKGVFRRKLAFLEFEQSAEELESPDCDVVGIAFRAGARRYFWNSCWWSEFPLEIRLELGRIRTKMETVTDEEFEHLLKIMEWVEKYKKSPPPEHKYKDKELSLWFRHPQIKGQAVQHFLHESGPKRITRVIKPIS